MNRSRSYTRVGFAFTNNNVHMPRKYNTTSIEFYSYTTITRQIRRFINSRYITGRSYQRKKNFKRIKKKIKSPCNAEPLGKRNCALTYAIRSSFLIFNKLSLAASVGLFAIILVTCDSTLANLAKLSSNTSILSASIPLCLLITEK